MEKYKKGILYNFSRSRTAGEVGGTSDSRTGPVAPRLTVAEAICDPQLDLRPWAAYTLSYHNETLPFWQQWHRTGYGSNVLVDLDFLGYASGILRPEVPAEVAAKIKRTIDRVRSLHGLMDNAGDWMSKGRSALYELASSRIETHRRSLKIEVALHDDGSKPYHAWGRLGQAMGRWDYDRAVSSVPDCPQVAPTAALGGLRWVARVASSLPDYYQARIPLAAKLAALVDERSYPDAATICRAIGHSYPIASPSTSDAAHGDHWLWLAMRDVHVRFLEDLLLYPAEPDRPPAPASPSHQPGPAKPRWDADSGRLFYGSQEVRTVGAMASNLLLVLAAFEGADWPESITNPLKGNADPSQLGDAVRSLNKRLSLIKFHRRGNMINWEVTKP